jgi:5'-methylthioadenosine phosphorylase
MREIKIGLIGGSGLGAALASQNQGRRHEIETPFGKTSDAVLETAWGGVPVFVISRHGEGHRFNPTQVPYRANIFALKQLGVTHIIASGAVGSLRDAFKPRQLVIPDQIIDKTHKRANTFYENAAVHVEFAEPFCPVLRRILLETAQARAPEQADVPAPATAGPIVHPRGCYVAMEGPAFSTRAESLMHRLWGGDLIGMTCMPEAKLAREAEIAYALVALVTDYDCWKTDAHPQQQETPDPFLLLREIIGNLEAATANAMALMKRAVETMAGMPADALESPAHHALRLGIWSDKTKLPVDEVQRLATLWGAYFQ